jgi:ATP-binding cassette subfamily B protein
MKKRIKIKQHDLTDCGAACLASVAAYYDLKLPIARIRQMASTDKKGTNVLGLIEAAEKLNFIARGVKSLTSTGEKNFDPLQKIPLPAIAHVTVKDNYLHFIVIYKISSDHITVMDPADGQLHKCSLEEFAKIWTGILILLVPNEEFKPLNSKVSAFSRFWFLLKPHKKIMLQALFGSIVYTVLGLSMSVYVQKIIDFVIPDGNRNLLNLLSTAMIIILLLQISINYMRSVFMFKTGQKIDARLILGYYKHLFHLPQNFFDSMRVGEINSRLSDAVKIRSFINETIPGFIVSMFILMFAIALMFTYYWKLALIIFAIVPFYAIVYIFYNKVNKKTQRKLMEEAADVESQLVESLNTAETIKIGRAHV